MTFLSRELLWLMLLVPALAGTYLLLLKRRTAVLVLSDTTIVRTALERSAHLRRHVPPAVLLLAVAALLLGAARPAAVVPVLAAQRTVVMVIDVSLSMAATDIAPSRLAAAQAAAKRFIRSQPRDVKIALVAFAATADIVQAPTTNRAELDRAIDGLTLDYHTAVGSGLVAALLTLFPNDDIAGNYDVFGGTSAATLQQVSLDRSQRIQQREVAAPGSYTHGAIVLLTDGSRTMGLDPLLAARAAADRGVRVYTVGFGTAQHAKVAVDGWSMEVGFDEETLKHVAEATRGEYFKAASAEALDRVYGDLATQLIVENKQIELTALLSALAAALALTAAGLSTLWCRRLS
jgi:Ca-activated chloride channel family protein